MADKSLTLAPKDDGSYTIKRGDKTVAAIVFNGEGWRACRMPGLRAFSPVGMNDLQRVQSYALRELEKEAA